MAKKSENKEERNLTEERRQKSAANRKERRRLDRQRDRAKKLEDARKRFHGGEMELPTLPEDVDGYLEDSLSAFEEEFLENREFQQSFLAGYNGPSYNPKKDSLRSLAERDPVSFANAMRRAASGNSSKLLQTQKDAATRLSETVDRAFGLNLSEDTDRRMPSVRSYFENRQQVDPIEIGGEVGAGQRASFEIQPENEPEPDTSVSNEETVTAGEFAAGQPGLPDAQEDIPDVEAAMSGRQSDDAGEGGGFLEFVDRTYGSDQGAFELKFADEPEGVRGVTREGGGLAFLQEVQPEPGEEIPENGMVQYKEIPAALAGAYASSRRGYRKPPTSESANGEAPSGAFQTALRSNNAAVAGSILKNQERGGVMQAFKQGAGMMDPMADIGHRIDSAFEPQIDRMSAFSPGFMRSRDEIAGDRSLSDEERSTQLRAVRSARQSGGREVTMPALGDRGAEAVLSNAVPIRSGASGVPTVTLGPGPADRIAGAAQDVRRGEQAGNLSKEQAQNANRYMASQINAQIASGRMTPEQGRDALLALNGDVGTIREPGRGGPGGSLMSKVPHRLMADIERTNPAAAAQLYMQDAAHQDETRLAQQQIAARRETEILKQQLALFQAAQEADANASEAVLDTLHDAETIVTARSAELQNQIQTAFKMVSDPRRMETGMASMNVAMDEKPLTAEELMQMALEAPGVRQAQAAYDDALAVREGLALEAARLHPGIDVAAAVRRQSSIEDALLSDFARRPAAARSAFYELPDG